jgi:large conductance mechanosensitive channel
MQETGNPKAFLDFGSFVSAIVYFISFMAVIYFSIVIPYRFIQARRGVSVFGEPAPAKTCPSLRPRPVGLWATAPASRMAVGGSPPRLREPDPF